MPGFEPWDWEVVIAQMKVENQEKPISKGKARSLVLGLFTIMYQWDIQMESSK